ncbi:MAG: GIY-YIG nuclease family protein [Deltaproteobacteria bacterium]|nr:MAG: GIY-YIG nuclease family protein [Deltaproteobacteria bacterium]
MDKTYFVYMMTNENNTVLYTGMTNDLERRVMEHKNEVGGDFSSKYKTTKLVYYDTTNQVEEAIMREKKIKKGSRKKKVELIKLSNPGWKDLSQSNA